VGQVHDSAFTILAKAILNSPAVTALIIDGREVDLKEIKGETPMLAAWHPTLSTDGIKSQNQVTVKSFFLYAALMSLQSPGKGMPWVSTINLGVLAGGSDVSWPDRVFIAMANGFRSNKDWLANVKTLVIPEPSAPVSEDVVDEFFGVLCAGACRLTEFSVTGVAMTYNSLVHMVQLCGFRMLRKLHLVRCSVESVAAASAHFDEVTLAEAISALPDLDELSLFGNPIKHWVLSLLKLGNSGLLDRLKVLDLGRCQLSEASVKIFAELMVEFKHLEVLILRAAGETANGLDALCENMYFKKALYSLHTLDMGSCRLTPMAAECLARWAIGGAAIGANLQYMGIHHNKFSDSSAELLGKALKDCPRLKIQLHDCGISGDMQQKLFQDHGERAGGCSSGADVQDIDAIPMVWNFGTSDD